MIEELQMWEEICSEIKFVIKLYKPLTENKRINIISLYFKNSKYNVYPLPRNEKSYFKIIYNIFYRFTW